MFKNLIPAQNFLNFGCSLPKISQNISIFLKILAFASLEIRKFCLESRFLNML